MRPVLLYDGYCNFCIRIAKILEILNIDSFSGRSIIDLIPFQSAVFAKEKYGLTNHELTSQIHLITSKGEILKGGEAIAGLGEYFPKFNFLFMIFKTSLGKSVYKIISRNRTRIFGCSKSCYISPQI